MAADNGASPPQRPGFFKLLFPHPSNNLRIPKKFHTHFPSKLPKMATLLCPHAESWHVEIYQTGEDIFFQRGWPEFSKAHDLHIGYLLLFRYTCFMNFVVEMFDTSCCHKDYPLKSCTSLVYPPNEVEVSSGSKDPSLSDESDAIETHLIVNSLGGKMNSAMRKVQKTGNEQINGPKEQTARTHCKTPTCIDIEESSESSETQKCNKEAYGIQINSFMERSNSFMGPKDFQMEDRSKKNLMNARNATNFAEFEKILTPSMVQNNMICLPKAFCVRNGIVANCTMFLKRKLEGKVVPNEWRVEFFPSPTCVIRNGWKKFYTENGLKIGDRCTFRLVSGDTLLVEKHGLLDCLGDQVRSVKGKVRQVSNEEKWPTSQQNSLRGSNSKKSKCIDIKDLTESDSRVSDAEIPGNSCNKRKNFSSSKEENEEEEIEKLSLRKKILKIDPNSDCFEQFEKIVTHTAEKYSSIMAPDCLSTEGKKKLGSQGTSSPPIASMKQTITCIRENQRDNTQCERVIKKYNLTAYMSLPMLFCKANGLVREQTIYLKRSINGKTWFVHFYPRKYEGKFCAGWRAFASENGLEEGDLCTFQLLSGNTLQVNIVRKCQKEMAPDCLSTEGKKKLGSQGANSPPIASMKETITCIRENQRDNTQCECVIKKYNLTAFMNLPISFCRINKLTSSSLVIMKAPDRKVWCVNFYFNKSKGCRFYGKGWKKFAFDNGLKVGDECLIKLVDKKTVLVQVVKS